MKRKMMRLMAFSVAMAMFASPVTAKIIDNFNQGSGSVSAGLAGSDSDSESGLSTANTIGGQRDMDIPGSVNVSGIGNLTMKANPVSSGLLSFSLDAGTSGSAKLTWDAGSTLGGEDLTDSGLSNFVTFDILSIDQGFVDLVITIQDTDDDIATKTISNAGVGTQQALFSSFSNFAATDFASVKSIMLEIQGIDGSDLTLDQFFTSGQINNSTPEPTSIALAICGLLGLTISRRRRRRL